MPNALEKLIRLYQVERVKIVGMMTGSSADGLDLCLVEFTGRDQFPEYKVLDAREFPLPPEFGSAFKRPLELSTSESTNLSFKLGKWYAEQVAGCGWAFDLIASHGQTLVHAAPRYTLQIGEPGYLAARFNRPVIFDFRTRDVVMGGQGAPLIPIVDELLFRHATESRLGLNIGGIANITLLPPKNSPLPVIAWDTGPGNTLLDRTMMTWTQGEQAFDPNGENARAGRINQALLEWLRQHPYCGKKPPKSAGQEEFGIPFFQEIMDRFTPKTAGDWQDLLATLTEFTSVCIAGELKRFGRDYPTFKRLFIGGGGSRNVFMMERLRALLPQLEIESVNLAGIDSDNKEAFGFAYLGYLWLRQLPGNLPSVTGARKPVVLGKLCI